VENGFNENGGEMKEFTPELQQLYARLTGSTEETKTMRKQFQEFTAGCPCDDCLKHEFCADECEIFKIWVDGA
jgi:hypothetical protein